jgi:hypothetical protein
MRRPAGPLNFHKLGCGIEFVVLGARFTSSAPAARLGQQVAPGTRILLAGDETARGHAYGVTVPMRLPIVAADRLSIWPDKQHDFVERLLANGHLRKQKVQNVPLPERVIPRVVCGD